MKKMHYSDWLHILIGMMIFCIGWGFFYIEIGVLAIVLLAFLKEINDTFLILPFLKTSNNRGFSFRDFILSIGIPVGIYMIHQIATL